MSRRTDLYRELIRDVNEIKNDVRKGYERGLDDHKAHAQAEIDNLSKAVDYWIAQWEIKRFELKEAEERIKTLENALADAKEEIAATKLKSGDNKMKTFEPEGIQSAIIQILEDNKERDHGVSLDEILCWTADIIGFVPRMDNLIDASELEFTIKEQLLSLRSNGNVEWMANRHYRLY